MKDIIERKLSIYSSLVSRKNQVADGDNGVFFRWRYPVLTKNHIPLPWKYDFNLRDNPFFMERLGVNAVFNTGAILLRGKFYLVARVEGNDRKSFFAVAESDSGVDGFEFWDYPLALPGLGDEANVYDMRLTRHEDGWIYGVFCSEKKDRQNPSVSAAVASAGIVRTRDLHSWERLPNLVTDSPQQRNVILHPEFVNGKYGFYTRPQDDFCAVGTGGGICFGLCDDIEHPRVTGEVLVSPRRYHTVTEEKNGAGAPPIRTERGWLHIAHGVRTTASGLRYVLYLFVTDLREPWKLIAQPSGYFIAPAGGERLGDVSNVVFTNGAVATETGDVYIYYASSDTRIHVATSTIDRLLDYAFHTPEDPLFSEGCVRQRYELIAKNYELFAQKKKSV